MTLKQYSMPYIRLGNGETLILIHGLGESKEGWSRQFELANQFDLVIPDLRGHGDNDNLTNISISTFAADILDLMDELNIEKAHVCGLSMGGVVAQEIYRQAPSRVKSLILASTFHYMPKGTDFLLKAMKLFNPLRLSLGERAARICLYSWSGENYEEFKKHYRPNPRGFELSAKECVKANNLSLLPTIEVPTLVMGGQYDSILPCWIQIDMHKRIPHSKLIIYRNCGHVSKLEQSQEFNQDVREFLTKGGQYAV